VKGNKGEGSRLRDGEDNSCEYTAWAFEGWLTAPQYVRAYSPVGATLQDGWDESFAVIRGVAPVTSHLSTSHKSPSLHEAAGLRKRPQQVFTERKANRESG